MVEKPVAEIAELIADLKNNYDVEYWGALLDEFEHRVAGLHKSIDGAKYTEWGLLALRALQGDNQAQSLLNGMPPASSEEKKIMDEIALLYLVQPVLRHYLFRATN
ncbi:MAG: hypothetical protein QGG84_00330, partial [Rhodospirillales bacterium]|nr:hypothetical protein [Rhodospirillales bacterium]